MTRRQLLCSTLAVWWAPCRWSARKNGCASSRWFTKSRWSSASRSPTRTPTISVRRFRAVCGRRSSYDVELRMLVAGWVDRTIASSVVSISVQYDNLTRRHSLSRTVDGRIDEAVVTEDEEVVAKWLTSVERLPLCSHRQARTESRLLRPRQRPKAPAAHLPVLPGPARPAARPSSPSSRKSSSASTRLAELCAAAMIRGFEISGFPGAENSAHRPRSGGVRREGDDETLISGSHITAVSSHCRGFAAGARVRYAGPPRVRTQTAIPRVLIRVIPKIRGSFKAPQAQADAA